MIDIDYIIKLLDENNSTEEQLLGIKLAEKIQYINVFCQPKNKEETWVNCAEILAKRSDNELRIIVHELLFWIKDLNIPGACTIFNRLKNMTNLTSENLCIKDAIKQAIALDNKTWYSNLLTISLSYDTPKKIDDIMDLISWQNSTEEQEYGIEIAKKIENIDVFFFPSSNYHSKDLWENCAKIVASKSDEELEPYLGKMFEWLQDLNCPGATVILERLLKFSASLLKNPLEQQVKLLAMLDDNESNVWLMFLSELLLNVELVKILDSETNKCLMCKSGKEYG